MSNISILRSIVGFNSGYTTTTNTTSTQFKFKFIPTVKSNNKKNPIDSFGSNPSSSSIKQKRLTSHSFPSNGILEQHEEKKEKVRESEIIKSIATNQTNNSNSTTTTPTTISPISPKKRKKRILRARKAVITLTPRAVEHLKKLLDLPEPKMIRVSTKNRGCSGTQYDLSYVTAPEKFDEIVEQDGVRIIIDSKALFSVVGSEMDWIDDQLNTKFIFKNPNSKGTCGCGESFMV